MNGNVGIAYFSGTGSTKLVSETIEKTFSENSFNTTLFSIDKNEIGLIENIDMLVLIYPVYAFSAPDPVTEWIENLIEFKGLPTVVISVSGGGEVWPNTLSRVDSIKNLENKGYLVFYEEMIVMPSNIFMKTNDHLSMWLLKALPIRAEKIVNEIILKKVKRKNKTFGIVLIRFISKMESIGIKIFGLSLKTNEKCNSCGWCEKNCPRKNIVLVDGNPKFKGDCIGCLRCIYGCPTKAIHSSNYDFFRIKEGYSIDKIKEKILGVELESIKKCSKGIFWMGVRKYLLEIYKEES